MAKIVLEFQYHYESHIKILKWKMGILQGRYQSCITKNQSLFPLYYVIMNQIFLSPNEITTKHEEKGEKCVIGDYSKGLKRVNQDLVQ